MMQNTMRQLMRIGLILLCSSCAVSVGWAQPKPVVPKVALVIGNQHYAEDKSLPNVLNDAQLMARTLSQLGFVVTESHDLRQDQMAGVVAAFADSIPVGATALVYYAGHGMQVGGQNYLNPVDMKITSELKTPLRAYPLQFLLDRLALAKSAVNIVVLDACRNNPFRQQGQARYRSLADLGLSGVHAPRGTLVAYSTAPGQLAADGDGPNSLYTSALSRLLRVPGVELEDVFKQVGTEVRRKTLDDQIPWYESSITDSYYFIAPVGVSMVAGKSLQKNSLDNTVVSGGTANARGSVAADASNMPWFRQLDGKDWSEVDWKIQQQLKWATADQIPMLEHQAMAGNVVAQTTLGIIYRDGIDRAQVAGSGQVIRFHANNTKAVHWLSKAAEAGFPVAQAELGEMYFAGHGVEHSMRNSQHWLTLAAQAQYPRAKLDRLQFDIESNPAAAQADLTAAMGALMSSMRATPSVQPAQSSKPH